MSDSDDQKARRFTIGQLARQTGLTVKTIRWYSDQGLVPPVRAQPGRVSPLRPGSPGPPAAGPDPASGRPGPGHHRVGAVLEASSFHPGRTARSHLRVQALAGRIGPARVEEALALVGLTDAADRRVGGFSLGMRQRLGLAAALLADPEVLLLDEPANGLDPEGVRWLRTLLRGLADKGRTLLVSSHLLAEVARTVDSVVILDRGRLVAQSPLEQLTAAAGAGAHQVVRLRTSAATAQELRAALVADGARAQLLAPDRLQVSGATPERVGMLAAERSIPLFESTTRAPNLEDVFFQLTAAPASAPVPALQEQEASR